jgi:hypothetical protein
MGTGTQWQGLGNNALGIWGNTLNQGYQNQLDAWKANQSSSSGIGGALGLIGGMLFAADGGEVPEYDPNGAIPVSASPSGGRAIDDVPARVTPGEFVVPLDVVKWKGEEFFQKMIKQSREAKSAPDNARPDIRPAPRSAIPVAA